VGDNLLVFLGQTQHIHIDGKGQFYSQDGKSTNHGAALDRAMPVDRGHSQNEYENGLGWDDDSRLL